VCGQSAKFVVISPPVAGTNITVYGISDDGSTVVGAVNGSAYRWTEASGVELLWQGYALDASADGNVLVGGTGAIFGSGVAVRWSAGVMQQLAGAHVARAVSADGGVVVGGTAESAAAGRAFRWTAASGLQLVPSIQPGAGGYAFDISADGNVIVGMGNPSSGEEAFRWSAETGTVGFGYLPGGLTQDTIAIAASADGSVVAGYGDGVQLGEAFRWTSAGCAGLGAPAMMPGDMSGDGKIIVGEIMWTSTAAIWDAQRGIRPLQDDLEQRFGLALPGWSLLMATAISNDGTRIAGYATDPSGQRKAFLVVLPEAAGTGCYPDCNTDGTLSLSDFGCFQTRYALGDAYADCNGDGTPNLADFGCYQTKFAMGCP
jgi:uncharacterized membrane protein